MLKVYAFDRNGMRVVEDASTISDLVADKETETVVWADILGPTEVELAMIQQEFDLHPLAMEDATRSGQRPKLDLYESHAFLVAYASAVGNTELAEFDLFIGSNWLITVHEHAASGAHFDLDAVRERAGRTVGHNCSVAFLLYTVLDEIVDTYFGAVEKLGDVIDDIEERIFGDEDPEGDERPMQREMLEVRKSLLGFRRRVVPLREVLLMLLRDDLPFIDQESHHYFQDVLDHVMRVTDEIDNRRELIGNAVDAHLAMVSNQMNQIMKKMTSWGAILIVSTLISGIYGMNFDNMPELHWEHGFRIALFTMLVATGSLYLYFKRKRWI